MNYDPRNLTLFPADEDSSALPSMNDETCSSGSSHMLRVKILSVYTDALKV